MMEWGGSQDPTGELAVVNSIPAESHLREPTALCGDITWTAEVNSTKTVVAVNNVAEFFD